MLENNEFYSNNIIVYKYRGRKFVGEFESIEEICKKLEIEESHIKKYLAFKDKVSDENGYTFYYKRYRGEIITERRNSLNFKAPLETITDGLLSNLPNYPKIERIRHYNKKINQVFKNFKRRVS